MNTILEYASKSLGRRGEISQPSTAPSLSGQPTFCRCQFSLPSAIVLAVGICLLLIQSATVRAGGSGCQTQTGCTDPCTSGHVCDSCVDGWKTCYMFSNGEACFLYHNCKVTWVVGESGGECGGYTMDYEDYPC